MFSSLDISTSALVAQRIRLNAISSNLANVSTTHNEADEPAPYQPKFVVFQADDSIRGPGGATGVKVSSVETADVEPNWKYQPGHPDAVKEGERKGYVAYPNISMITEFTDALEATRAYEANIGVMEVTKELAQQSLRIVA
ncbi:MAG: flagellar basal body rod protein FlgC [Pirellulales bacterium]